MSGHSKWAKLKHGKDDRDSQKANLFAKYSRAITMAVIQGGGATDPQRNATLRFAIDKARQNNIPKENIQRAIERASGPDKQNLKEVQYEAFAPHGTALIIAATTDNPNRTHLAINMTLNKVGGKLARQGAVGYLFADRTPLFPIKLDADKQTQIRHLIESLESLDDVDTVISNAVL